jgi:hypothetical protein
MIRRFPLLSCALAVLALPESRAFAEASPGCRVINALESTGATPAWRDAVQQLEREVSVAPPSACQGTDLILTETAVGVRITAKARDGRQASRDVAAPAALAAVAFGMLASAPRETLPPPPVPSASTFDAEAVLGAASSFPSPPPPVWGLTFSASTGLRALFPTDVVVAEFALRADVLVHDWLLTFGLRAAPVVVVMRGPYDDDAYDETAIGLGFGRQLRIDRSVVSLTGGANVAYVWVENDALGLSAERSQLRLAAVARWSFAIDRAVRLNVTLDGEASPTGLINGSAGPGLTAFPAFTLGLHLGGEVLL